MFVANIDIYVMKHSFIHVALKSFFLLIVGTMVLSLNTQAQDIQLLHGGDIRNAGGFLIVENPKDFHHWTADLGIMTNTGFRPLGNDGTSWSVWDVGLLYLKPWIDSVSISEPLFIRVRGYSLSNQVIDEKVVPSLDGEPLPMKTWHCNSYDYDYRLVEVDHGSHLVYMLEDGPGYVWWPQDYFTSVDGPIGLQGYPQINNPGGFLAQHGALEEIPNFPGGPVHRNIYGLMIPQASDSYVMGLPKKILAQWAPFL
jgi:hypothetical protein